MKPNNIIKAFIRSPVGRKNYKIFYWFSRLFSVVWFRSPPDYDLVFVLPDDGKGWILDGICHEVGSRYSGKIVYCYGTNKLPKSKMYFFSHYWLLKSALLKNAYTWKRGKYVWFTHPKKELGISNHELAYLLNLSDVTICTCSIFENMLHKIGVEKEKLKTVLGAADPSLFKFHERSGKTVGFSSAFYERKCPDKLVEIISAMPELNFILLGRGWNIWHGFEKMLSLPNFTYVETEYKNYPKYYQEMDIFVSTSTLEGGPIPLVEAMMANIIPVVSDTGFARDIIDQGENGYIFPVDSDSGHICELIRQARANTRNIRKTVEHLSWDNFSEEVISSFAN